MSGLLRFLRQRSKRRKITSSTRNRAVDPIAIPAMTPAVSAPECAVSVVLMLFVTVAVVVMNFVADRAFSCF